LNRHFAISWYGRWGRWIVLAALAAGSIGSATAGDDPSIPSGFLAYPPYNGFVFEAVHLLPGRQDHLTVVEVDDDILSRAMTDIQFPAAASFDDENKAIKQRDEDRARQVKLTAVPEQFAGEFKAMQAATSGDAAYAIGKELPGAIRLYTAAAVDFHIAHPMVITRQSDWAKPAIATGPMDTEQRGALEKAIGRFQAVLELPDTAKPPRAVAAAYMLGRSYVLRAMPGDQALAEKAFVLTRSLARAGLPDPDGLAVASFGDQARLRRAEGDLTSTIGLYAEQAARGSVEGVESLKWVAQALYNDPQGMAKVENIPLAQRVLIAYALEINDDGRVHEYVYTPGGHPSATEDNGTIDLLLRTAQRWPRQKIAWPDRMAALAYRAGDFDFAHTLIDRQDTALAWWLKAKLLVTDGKLADGEVAYRRVVALSLASTNPDGLSPFNASAACAEMAQLERTRGEFIPAMRNQIACDQRYGGANDSLTTYLAERVLTTAEVRNILMTSSRNSSSNTDLVNDSDIWVLRSELAKRLIREGHDKEALPYANAKYAVSLSKDSPSFDTGLSESLKTQRDFMQAYATAHDQTKLAPSAVARAAAWYQLALLTRIQHEEIMDHDSHLYKENATPEFPGISSTELVRLKKNYKTPDQDGLRWYIAFDDALNAAQLVPHRSQAYAAILCHAAHWMNQAPPQAIGNRDPIVGLHQAWQLYLKHGAYVPWAERFGHQCPDPDFKEAAESSWWRRL